jgi:hypothetical protein
MDAAWSPPPDVAYWVGPCPQAFQKPMTAMPRMVTATATGTRRCQGEDPGSSGRSAESPG